MALLTISSHLLSVSFAIAMSCLVNGCAYVGCQKFVVVKWTKKLRRPNFTGDEMEVLIGGVERVSELVVS